MELDEGGSRYNGRGNWVLLGLSFSSLIEAMMGWVVDVLVKGGGFLDTIENTTRYDYQCEMALSSFCVAIILKGRCYRGELGRGKRGWQMDE